MPEETRQKMKEMHNDVEKVPYDNKGQYHSDGQDSQLKELVKTNTREICHDNQVPTIQTVQS
jgi:hypothetical protein